MSGFSGKSTTFMILIALLILLSIEQRTCTAKQGKKHWRQSSVTSTSLRHEDGDGQYPGQQFSKLMREMYKTMTTQNAVGGATVFNVRDYGAKGDGTTDDTEAFKAAWADACKVEASTMVVPSGSVFLVKPLCFLGPKCESNISFQLDGKIIAPTNSQAWESGPSQWLAFKELNGITVRGKGIIDGQGSVWWNKKISSTDMGKLPNTKPTALRFYGSSGVTVTGITIQNSQQAHLKLDNCTHVQVFDISVSSPFYSPNTDGIHLQNSQNVQIQNSNLACGDDCISIQTGCSGIYIHNVTCGPGHGISIGGLGENCTKACVSNVIVRDIKMHGTLTGVRIKTWQGGSGSVQGVMFANIQVSEVETPIVIDQFYCDEERCNNHTSAVRVSAISFQNITGTYTKKPVYFACSDSWPCIGVTLNTIKLTAKQESEPFCWQTYGKLQTDIIPHCLQAGKDPKYNVCRT